MIPEEKVREVAERVSIVEVISDYVPLRRSGSNFLGLCPFHGEKTPSFNVNPARDIFHCFGCGTGGNVFSFVMKIEGLTFPEAVKLLGRRAGVEIEERQLTPAERQAQEERQQFQQINTLAAEYFRTTLVKRPEGSAARSYLDRRSVSHDIAEAYRLGFAPDQRDGLVRYLSTHGASLDSALKLGIIRRGDHGWHDLFRNRLIFPIRDAKGQVIGFAGRVLDAGLPKYINSPESPVYHKSSVLFGLDMALPAIRSENAVIIVEGYFDHLALFRAGIRNVVATCGTALTPAHAGLIKRHAGRVYTLFDSDSAGGKATVKAMELFLEQRLPAYVISLPAGDDPDSYLAGNPVEAFTVCRDSARPAFEHFIRSQTAAHPVGTIDGKLRVMDELIPRFRKIADPVERDLYEKEIARLLGITVHAFRKRLGGMPVSREDVLPRQEQKRPEGDLSQETLLMLMGIYPEALQKSAEIGVEQLFDGEYLALATAMLAHRNDTDDGRLLARLAGSAGLPPEQQTLLSRLLVSDRHLTDIDWQVAFDQCLQRREKQELSSIKEIARRLAVCDPAGEEYALLLRQADALRSRKSKLQPGDGPPLR